MQNVSIPTTEPKATKHQRSASDSLILTKQSCDKTESNSNFNNDDEQILGSGVDQAAAPPRILLSLSNLIIRNKVLSVNLTWILGGRNEFFQTELLLVEPSIYASWKPLPAKHRSS